MLPLIARRRRRSRRRCRACCCARGGAMRTLRRACARAARAGRRRDKTYLDHASSPKKLKELRRQRRRLLEHGPAQAHDRARSGRRSSRALSDYLRLEAAGLERPRRHRRAAARRDPAISCMSAVTALAAEGDARVDRLIQDERSARRDHHAAQRRRRVVLEDRLRRGVRARFPRRAAHARLTEAISGRPGIARVDSCATADHPMIDHLWRERLALADLLIAPSAAAMAQFRIARHLETLRRALIAARNACAIQRVALRCPRKEAQPGMDTRLRGYERIWPKPVPQQPADDLAGRRHRHFADEGHLARIFVRRQPAS